MHGIRKCSFASSLKQEGAYHKVSIIYGIFGSDEGTDLRLRMTVRRLSSHTQGRSHQESHHFSLHQEAVFGPGKLPLEFWLQSHTAVGAIRKPLQLHQEAPVRPASLRAGPLCSETTSANGEATPVTSVSKANTPAAECTGQVRPQWNPDPELQARLGRSSVLCLRR